MCDPFTLSFGFALIGFGTAMMILTAILELYA